MAPTFDVDASTTVVIAEVPSPTATVTASPA
jgi:hypothetical protein